MKLNIQSAHLYTIAFSHKKLPLSLIGKLYLNPSEHHYKSQLEKIKHVLNATEIMHVSTCNRCEFYIVSHQSITKSSVQKIFSEFYTHLTIEEKNKITEKLIFKKDEKAVRYLMEVASSLQSMVVGEREIITQIRNAYEHCESIELTGDLLRIVIKKVIETAKEIFSETDIAKNPVSVASLAARQLQTIGISDKINITAIGSGITMQTFLKYFHQDTHQYTFISRNKKHSELLYNKYGGKYMSIQEFKAMHHLPTDVLIVCTSSPYPIITKEIYYKLFQNHSKAIIVDLSNPSDVSEEVLKTQTLKYISIASLKKQATENLKKRKEAITIAHQIITKNMNEFLSIFKERCIENIISDIPTEIKKYKNKALDEVFKKQMDSLSPQQQETIREIADYLEGKFNSVTYKKIKNILLQ